MPLLIVLIPFRGNLRKCLLVTKQKSLEHDNNILLNIYLMSGLTKRMWIKHSILSPLCVCLVTQLCPTLCDPIHHSPPGSSVHGDSRGKNTGVGCHALLQGIFPPQGSNPGLLHCSRILYHLSHQGSPYFHYIDNIIKKKIGYIMYYVHEFQLHGNRKWLEILDFVHAWVNVSIVPLPCISLLYVFICSLFII